MTPWLDAQGLERYRCWRRQWRANVETQTIAILRHHGMARVLFLAFSRGTPRGFDRTVPVTEFLG